MNGWQSFRKMVQLGKRAFNSIKEQNIMIALLGLCDEKGECIIFDRQLCNFTRLTRNAYVQALEGLMKKGLVSIEDVGMKRKKKFKITGLDDYLIEAEFAGNKKKMRLRKEANSTGDEHVDEFIDICSMANYPINDKYFNYSKKQFLSALRKGADASDLREASRRYGKTPKKPFQFYKLFENGNWMKFVQTEDSELMENAPEELLNMCRKVGPFQSDKIKDIQKWANENGYEYTSSQILRIIKSCRTAQ